MSLAEVKRALRDPEAVLVLDGAGPVDACAYLESRNLPEGIGLMFQEGRAVRMDVWSRSIQTASGVGVGDSEARIKQVYGQRVVVERHFYDPQGHYLKVEVKSGKDRGYGIVFETDGARVTSYRVGKVESIAPVEGCL